MGAGCSSANRVVDASSAVTNAVSAGLTTLETFLSPDCGKEASYHGFTAIRKITVMPSAPSSLVGAAVAVVQIAVALVDNYTARTQFVKALESRLSVIRESVIALQRQTLSTASLGALKHLLEVLVDYCKFVDVIVHRPTSIFATVVDFFRAKSDLDNLKDYDVLFTRCLDDLHVPLAVQQLEHQEAELRLLDEISRQTASLKEQLQQRRVLNLAKKVLTNEEAFTFWCDCFPDKFQVSVEECRPALRAWLKEFRQVELRQPQVESLIAAINVGTVDEYIDVYEVNLFFSTLPLRYHTADFDVVVLAAGARARAKRLGEDDEGAKGGSADDNTAEGGGGGVTSTAAEGGGGATAIADKASEAQAKLEEREALIEGLQQCNGMSAWLWYKIGLRTKAKGAGAAHIRLAPDSEPKAYGRRECFVEAVRRDDALAGAWNNIAVGLGLRETVEVGGVSLAKLDCYVKALSGNPNYARAWYNLAFALDSEKKRITDEGTSVTEGPDETEAAAAPPPPTPSKANSAAAVATAVLVNGRMVNKRDCYVEAIRCYPDYALGWNALGLLLPRGATVTVPCTPSSASETLTVGQTAVPTPSPTEHNDAAPQGVSVTKQMCFLRALLLDRKNAVFWKNVASTLATPDECVDVTGISYTKRDLLAEALRCEVATSSAFRSLCAQLKPEEPFALALRIVDGTCERVRL